MRCPNKQLEEYKLLEEEFGEGTALAAWVLHGEDKIPTVQEANELVGENNKNIYLQKANKTIKNELQDELQGKSRTRENNLIQTALDFYRGMQETGQRIETGSTEGKQKTSFVNWISDNNLYYKEPLPERTPDAQGTENKMWINSDGKTVTKLHFDSSHYLTDKEFLNSLIIHNHLFPDTAYKLLGFVDDIESYGREILAVLKQPYVKKNGETRVSDIIEWMNANGFVGFGEGKKAESNFYNSEIGLYIKDLHAENVIIRDNTPFFIDTDCSVDGTFWQNKNELLQKSNNNKILKYDLQSILNRAVSGRLPEGTFKSAFDIARGIKGNIQKATGRKELESKITEAGLWYKGELGNEVGGGIEHAVFETKDIKHVIKLNYSLDTAKDLQEYLENVLVYNHLFPKTVYELLGFSHHANRVSPVTKQIAVKPNSEYNEKVVDNVLALMGFNKTSEVAYKNPIGVGIWDINKTNVLFRDNIPFFIDPRIAIDDSFLSDYKSTSPNVSIEAPDPELSKRIQDFVKTVNGSIRYVPQIIVKGQVVDANAVTDIMERTIEIADGKENVDTLPEEAAHLYVGLLPETSPILCDMMKDIEKYSLYDEVYEEYKNDPYYQNEDGEPDEEKIKYEAIGQLIGQAMRNETTNRKALGWWQRLWNWIKSIFQGKQFDTPFEEAASDILDNKVDKLDLKAAKDANKKGEIYFQHDDKTKEIIRKWKEKGITPVQQGAIDVFVTNNTMSMGEGHVYKDAANPTIDFTPVSKAIKGDFGDEVFSTNRDIGTDFHSIMEDRILGKTSLKDVVDTKYLTGEARGMVWGVVNQIYQTIKDEGNILLPEVILSDKDKGVAGTTDVIAITPSGAYKIIDFKTSKTKVLDSKGNPTKEYMEHFWDSKPGSWIGENLTTNLQQGIQLNCYNRMVSKLGVDQIKDFMPFGDNPETHHIHIEFENDGKTIKSITYEGVIQHPFSDNNRYVNKILGEDNDWSPTEQDIKSPLPDYSEDNLADSKIDTSNLEPSLKWMSKVLNDQISKTIDEVGGGSSASQLKYTVNLINNLTSIGEQKRALNVVLNYIEKVSKKYDKFINDPKRIQDPRYYPCLNECIKIVNSDLEILPEYLRSILDDKHKEKFDRVRDKLNRLNIDANLQASNYVKSVGGSGNPFVTQEQFKQIIFQNALDTSATGAALSPTGHLASEQLQHVAIVIKSKLMDGNVNADIKKAELIDKIKQIEDVLGTLKETDFDKFYKKDASGKPTTQLLTRIGDSYRSLYENLESNLIDEDGNTKQYIPDTTPEAIEYNKALYPYKEAIRKFRESESLSPNGDIGTGEYHHLTDEYKQAAEKVMHVEVTTDWDGNPLFHEWVPNKGKKWNGDKSLADSYFGEGNWEYLPKSKDIQLKYEKSAFSVGEHLPANLDPDLIEFRDKYQQWTEYWSMTKVKGQPTGKVVKKTGYFPKSEYVDVNDFNSVTGKDLRDENWKALHGIDNPLDDKGRASLDIYNTYIDYMKDATEKMGGDWNLALKGGGTLAMSNKLFNSASKDGALATINHNVAELWGRVPKGSEKTDVQGVAKMELRPVPLNNFRNNEKVQKLRDELSELNKQKEAGKVLNKEYSEKRKVLTEQLNSEDHKIAPEDMERNLLKSAIVYCMAAEGIKAQRDAEGQIQALSDTISGKILEHPLDPKNPLSYDPNSNVKHQKTKLKWATRYGVTDNEGNPIYLQPQDANTIKRLKQLERIFYNVNVDHGKLGQLINKFLNFTSFGVMTNPITNLKNFVLYQVMNSRAAIVSKYYPGKYYRNAWGEFMTEYIPGVAKKWGEQKNQYKDKKPGSFMEAFMQHYHIGTNERLSVEGAGTKRWLEKAYTLEMMNIKMAEYSNIAGLAKSEQLTNSITGEIVNGYDQCHTWNPETGEFSLKDGFSPDDMKRVILKGRQIQVECQGNFERVDQPGAKETLAGLVTMQFKNFLPSAMNTRYSKRRNDLIFGPQEGSWITPVSWLHLIQEANGNFRERIKTGWNNLTPDQKKNLWLDLVDIMYLGAFTILGIIVANISKGIDSEDTEQKRMANLLATIINTIRFENQMYTPGIGVVQMAEFMENPAAMSTTLKSIATAIYLTTEWPFQDEDSRNYKNGIFVGTSKAAYQWKKALPILKSYQRWQRQLTDTQAGFWNEKN